MAWPWQRWAGIPTENDWRPILAKFAGGEDEASWLAFFQSLPGTPRLIVSDRAPSIIAAIKRAWPGATPVHYYCHQHFARNAADAAGRDGIKKGDPFRDELEDLLDSDERYEEVFRAATDRGATELVSRLAEARSVAQELAVKRAAYPELPHGAGPVETVLRSITCIARIAKRRKALGRTPPDPRSDQRASPARRWRTSPRSRSSGTRRRTDPSAPRTSRQGRGGSCGGSATRTRATSGRPGPDHAAEALAAPTAAAGACCPRIRSRPTSPRSPRSGIRRRPQPLHLRACVRRGCVLVVPRGRAPRLSGSDRRPHVARHRLPGVCWQGTPQEGFEEGRVGRHRQARRPRRKSVYERHRGLTGLNDAGCLTRQLGCAKGVGCMPEISAADNDRSWLW